MNPTPHDSPHGPLDPECLLARGLRDTTPAFESRFDDMRRRLALETPPPSRLAACYAWIRSSRRLAAGAIVAAAALTVLVAVRHERSGEAGLEDPERWYDDALALEGSLRAALVLADAEARDVVTHFPTETSGGGS